MKKARWVSAAAGTVVLVAGFAAPASAALADGGGDGNGGVLSVLSGNTVNAPVSLPVDVCGVAVGLLGGADAGCAGGAASNTVISNGGGGDGNGNAGVASVGSGNTVNLPVSIPVNVCGVAGSAAGFSNADCKGGAKSSTVINGGGGGDGNGNAGDISALSGNTLNAPVSIPVNVCGVSAAVAGFSSASCQGGSFSNTTVGGPTRTPCPTPPPSCNCTQPKHHHHKTPPPSHHKHHHTPPGGGGGGGGTPPNSGNGSTTTTVPGSLPITGANILGMLVAAAGLVGIGGTSLVIARRRRNSEA